MNKKVVYVTGCFGFIGSYVTRACLKKGWHVMGIDKMTYAYFPDAYDEFIGHPNFSFKNIDINDFSDDEIGVAYDAAIEELLNLN